MIRNCIISLLALYALNECWVLWGARAGNMLVVFGDGQTHGVTLWWFVKGIADAVINIAYCACAVILSLQRKQLSRFFLILCCYHIISLLIWMYNYSTERWLFYFLYGAALVYGILILKTKKLKAV
jgi:hypothetical protein